MQNEKGTAVSATRQRRDLVVSSTDETSRYPELRKEVTQLLSAFAKAYETRSFTSMRRLLSDGFRGNFAGRKTVDGLVVVFRNYRLQMPFFMNVRMTITIRSILTDKEQEFAGIIELTTRAKALGWLLERSFATPPLLITAARQAPGGWRITGLNEDIDHKVLESEGGNRQGEPECP